MTKTQKMREQELVDQAVREGRVIHYPTLPSGIGAWREGSGPIRYRKTDIDLDLTVNRTHPREERPAFSWFKGSSRRAD